MKSNEKIEQYVGGKEKLLIHLQNNSIEDNGRILLQFITCSRNISYYLIVIRINLILLIILLIIVNILS